MRRTTQAQRRRIVEVLYAADGRVPSWIEAERSRRRRAQRIRQVQVLQLQAGLPVTDFESREDGRCRGRPRGRAEPIEIAAIEAEWKRNQHRQRAYGMPHGLPAPWGQILSPPWRPRW
jgi:hypothetical protein